MLGTLPTGIITRVVWPLGVPGTVLGWVWCWGLFHVLAKGQLYVPVSGKRLNLGDALFSGGGAEFRLEALFCL